MSENRTFRLFHRKKKNPKNPEKGHREPIVVRMFKDFNEETVATVSLEKEQKAENPEGKAGGEAASSSSGTWDGVERRHRKFEHNQKYFTIMIYGLMFVFLGVIIVSCILKISAILDFLKGVLKVLAPFLIGAMLAFIMNPIVSLVERGFFQGLLRIKKPKLCFVLSIILSYVIVLGLVVFGLTKLGPQLADSIQDLVRQSSQIYDKIIGYANSLGEKFPAIDFSAVVDKVAETLPTIVEKFTSPDSGLLPTIFNTSVAIVRGIINTLLGIALSIYMVCDKRRIARAATTVVYAIAPYKKAKAFINVSRECFQIFGGFIIGKALDSLIIGIITFIVVSILRLPYTVLVSVIVGVTNLIPFFGPLIGAIPGLIIYLCIDPWYALVFGIAILAIQQFDGWILGPMILGDSTGIRPIWVIFGITFFGAYFGVLGMFLGVPITAVLIFLIERVLNKRLKKKHIEIT